MIIGTLVFPEQYLGKIIAICEVSETTDYVRSKSERLGVTTIFYSTHKLKTIDRTAVPYRRSIWGRPLYDFIKKKEKKM